MGSLVGGCRKCRIEGLGFRFRVPGSGTYRLFGLSGSLVLQRGARNPYILEVRAFGLDCSVRRKKKFRV